MPVFEQAIQYFRQWQPIDPNSILLVEPAYPAAFLERTLAQLSQGGPSLHSPTHNGGVLNVRWVETLPSLGLFFYQTGLLHD